MKSVALNDTLEDFLEYQRVSTNALLQRISDGFADNTVGRAMQYALQGDGKRLRPAFCVATYWAMGGSREPAIQRLAAALEILHTYSLVHDDLPCMDNDDVRRGRQTTHRVFGDGAAIVAGAALIPLAFGMADAALGDLHLPVPARQHALNRLAQATGAAGMVGGQLLDLQAGAQMTSAPELERIHAAKTGALIVAACVLGALAARASSSQLLAIETYARHLGLAFQIADDVLDETASTAELGKTAGKDRDFAKATYPAVLGLDGARTRAREEATRARQALLAGDIKDKLLNELAAFAIERRR